MSELERWVARDTGRRQLEQLVSWREGKRGVLISCFNGVEQEGGILLQGLGMPLLLQSIPRCVPLIFFRVSQVSMAALSKAMFLVHFCFLGMPPVHLFSEDAAKLKTLFSLSNAASTFPQLLLSVLLSSSSESLVCVSFMFRHCSCSFLFPVICCWFSVLLTVSEC